MKRIYLLFAIIMSVSAMSAQDKESRKRLTVWFDTPTQLNSPLMSPISGDIKNWEQNSLPIGNGSLGANIMGSIPAEHITLNEKSLWRGGPNTKKGAAYYWNVNKQSAHILTEIRKAFSEGDSDKAGQLTRQHFNGLAGYEENSETPFRFGSFTTMGELYVETGLHDTDVTNYRRSLSLDSAVCTVSFTIEGVNYERTSFISYPDSVMVLRFSADKPGMQNLILRYVGSTAAQGSIIKTSDDEVMYLGHLKDNNMKFVLRIRVVSTGGTVEIANDGHIFTRDADDVVFLVTADTDYKMNFNPDFSKPDTYVGVSPEITTREMMYNAAHKGYGELLSRHKADYTSLFSRVRLNINPHAPSTLQYPAVTDLPTYKRLELYRKGGADYALEELYYQYGRYLMIAGSRAGSLPLNLQGMWSKGVDAPWHADYHNNINLQMNYWPVCSANLEECATPMFDFIRTLVKSGQHTAYDYFGARGWTASISANIFGFTSPLSSNDMSWNFSPMAGPWLATHIWEYYDYTRDISFLRDSYDVIKGSAMFASDYLWKRDDGTYTAAPSTSPEHGPIDRGATFVHAVAREILTDAVKASEILKTDARERKRWKHILRNIAPYSTGRYGQLMEWADDIDDPNDDHRHVNHLFGLFPGHSISPLTTPELAEASRTVLEHRGDGATGWSMGWKLNLWAHLYDGDHSYKLFRNLLSHGTLDNLWDSHPPFQIDGNFGGTSGITEMLLQSDNGIIHLLPAIPGAWNEGSVEGLRARGNYTVDISWKEGRLSSAVIHANSGGKCTIYYKGMSHKLKARKGCSYMITVKTDQLNVSIMK